MSLDRVFICEFVLAYVSSLVEAGTGHTFIAETTPEIRTDIRTAVDRVKSVFGYPDTHQGEL